MRWSAARPSLAQAAAADVRLQTALAYLDAYFAGEALKLTTLTSTTPTRSSRRQGPAWPSSAGSSQEVLASTGARGHGRGRVRRAAAAAERGRASRWSAGSARRPTSLPRRRPCRRADEQAYVASHPMVVAAQRDIEVARQEAAVAAREPQAELDLGGVLRPATGYSDMVSFGVSIPLPMAPAERQDRETASKLALVDKAEAELAEATRAAAAEYRALASDARACASASSDTAPRWSPRPQQRTAAALAAYRSNQAPLMALFEARHAEVEAQRKLLDAAARPRQGPGPARLQAARRRRRPMKRAHVIVAVAAAPPSLVGRQLLRRPSTPARRSDAGAGGAGGLAPAERKVLYWHDPMVPGQRFDKPGKSPFMDMQLVPVYADAAERRRRQGQPDGAAEPGHPHRDGDAGPMCRRPSMRSARCSSTNA